MDETSLQLYNKPGFVVAQRGSQNVAAITSCCSAEDTFLPPACIFMGKNKKAEFEVGMPPGSVVYMNFKSAYISSDIFLAWLRDHFVPRKPNGKVILIVDNCTTHCNCVKMLEYAEKNEIILLCLPSHTKQFLQPLDGRSVPRLKMPYPSFVRLPFFLFNRTQFLITHSFPKNVMERFWLLK